MNRLLLATVTVLFSWSAQAQFVLDGPASPNHLLRKPSPAAKQWSGPTNDSDNAELEKRARGLSEILVLQYNEILKPIQSTQVCDAGQIKALKISGRASEALALGETCLLTQTQPNAVHLELLLDTAQAAVAEFKFKRGMELYDRATVPGFSLLPDFKLAVLEYANLAMKTEYQDRVEEILKRGFSGDEVRLAAAALDLFFLGTSPLGKEPEIQGFVTALTLNASKRTKSFFHLQQIHHLDRNRYKYTQVIEYLEKNVQEILDPSEWIDNAYSGFYHQDGGDKYRVAQILYEAYLPYAHKFSWFPIETNTQNYTEIYGQTCKEKISQGDEYSMFNSLRTRYIMGVSDLPTAIGQFEELVKEVPGKADTLDLLAHLYTREGDDEAASQTYFNAHNQCPYYNRSHWGLTNILRRKRHQAFSDYQKRLEIMNAELKTLPAMNGLSSYIMNWEGLDSDAKIRLKYSMRFWANHIDFLVSTKQKVYIKRGFEFISHVPYMSAMRDERVTYQGDNRLWDDIRGLGGPLVIVDLEEMTDGPFGVYNLAGHEVAHQFHHSLPDALGKCVETLYENAKKRGVFADPYSGTNSSEYFAQGVGYHMWAQGTPKRFGLNRQWLLDNDKDLDQFLSSVLAAKSLSEITCSVEVE